MLKNIRINVFLKTLFRRCIGVILFNVSLKEGNSLYINIFFLRKIDVMILSCYNSKIFNISF